MPLVKILPSDKIRTMNLYKLPVLVMSLFLLASCGAAVKPGSSFTIEGLTEVSELYDEDETELSRVSIRDFDRKSAGSQVEVFWAIPEASVEGFVIHYGYSPHKLDHEVFLWSEDLEVALENDMMVYKHYLKDVHPQKRIFITISAFNEDGIPSEPSSLIEVN